MQDDRRGNCDESRFSTSTSDLQTRARELQAQVNFERAANSRQSAELDDAHRRYMSTQKALAEATAEIATLEQSIEQARLQAVRKADEHERQIQELQVLCIRVPTPMPGQ